MLSLPARNVPASRAYSSVILDDQPVEMLVTRFVAVIQFHKHSHRSWSACRHGMAMMRDKNTLYHPTIASTNGSTTPQTNRSAELHHDSILLAILLLPQMWLSHVDTSLPGRLQLRLPYLCITCVSRLPIPHNPSRYPQTFCAALSDPPRLRDSSRSRSQAFAKPRRVRRPQGTSEEAVGDERVFQQHRKPHFCRRDFRVSSSSSSSWFHQLSLSSIAIFIRRRFRQPGRSDVRADTSRRQLYSNIKEEIKNNAIAIIWPIRAMVKSMKERPILNKNESLACRILVLLTA